MARVLRRRAAPAAAPRASITMAPVRPQRALGVELGAAALDPTRELARRRVLPGRHVALRELVAAARAERGGALGSWRRVVRGLAPVCVPSRRVRVGRRPRAVVCASVVCASAPRPRAAAATPFVCASPRRRRRRDAVRESIQVIKTPRQDRTASRPARPCASSSSRACARRASWRRHRFSWPTACGRASGGPCASRPCRR